MAKNDKQIQTNNNLNSDETIYTLNYAQSDKKLLFKKMSVFLYMLVIAIALKATIPFEGMASEPYIILPFYAELIMAFLIIYSVIIFNRNKEELTQSKFEKSFIKIKPYCIIEICLEIGSIIATIVYMISNSYINFFSIFYILCCFASISGCMLLINLFKNMNLRKK